MKSLSVGEMQAIISVREFPPRESWRKRGDRFTVEPLLKGHTSKKGHPPNKGQGLELHHGLK